MPPPPRWRHIAIEGPIGVGKTSLARALAARLQAEMLLEQPQDNPYLERFYADGTGYAFQAQLAFLFQRARQMQALAQPGMFARPVVADFMFAKDALFARLNLDDDEYRLYAPMYARLASQVPPPELVIWLQATPATLLRRIRRRGIAMEQGLGAGELQRLSEAYAAYFAGSESPPVLAIDTERFDPAGSARNLDLLARHLARFRGPRERLEAPGPATPAPDLLAPSGAGSGES